MPIRDYYMRLQSDPKFEPGKIETNDEIEELVNQIKMTLLTNRGEVLGEPNFGVQIEKYLFEFDVDPFALSGSASNQIGEYISLARSRQVTVDPARIPDNANGYGRDVLVLNINIGDGKSFGLLYA